MTTTHDYSDTSFAIKDNGERYFWVLFHVFVLPSSFIGDSLILYASFQKNAFRLNKFIVVVIQYMAVCDILFTIVWELPVTISLIANSEILGEALCNVQDYLSSLIGFGIVSLIPVLTSSKLFLLKYPLRPSCWTKRKAHEVCWLSLLPSLFIALTKLFVGGDDIEFDYRIYGCDYKYTADTWRILEPILTVIGLYLPVLIVICTTIPTLKYLYAASISARRVQGSIPWQGAVTVTLTAGAYCISNLPLSVWFTCKMFLPSSDFMDSFYRVSIFALAINVMSNFYIYALSIRSFRRFVFSRIFASCFLCRSSILRRSSTVTAGR